MRLWLSGSPGWVWRGEYLSQGDAWGDLPRHVAGGISGSESGGPLLDIATAGPPNLRSLGRKGSKLESFVKRQTYAIIALDYPLINKKADIEV